MSTNGTKARRNGKKPIEKPKMGVGRNPTLIPGNPGNSGGKKGRSGRKRIEFEEKCYGLVDTQVLQFVEAQLQQGPGPSDAGWRWAAEYVSNYGLGKPAQSVKVSGDADAPLTFTMALGEKVLE